MGVQRPQKITFGEMRESGVRGVLIYCSDTHAAIRSPPTPILGRIGPDFHRDKLGAIGAPMLVFRPR